ncbi:MAG: GAF domain-containing protein [Candidatus Eremiobacteraeota bacterium]|nr:GAF domain-containing protein [Candidatus Eremiobacteraeota bacterium]
MNASRDDGSLAPAALVERVAAVLAGERDFIANAANAVAAIYFGMPDVNWVGTYRLSDDELVLGPFCGKPACVRIALDTGVCGAAATREETVVVDDVHAFEGHIACDAASASEIVVPLVGPQGLVGVLDVDSPRQARFGPLERAALEAIAALLVVGSDLKG